MPVAIASRFARYIVVVSTIALPFQLTLNLTVKKVMAVTIVPKKEIESSLRSRSFNLQEDREKIAVFSSIFDRENVLQAQIISPDEPPSTNPLPEPQIPRLPPPSELLTPLEPTLENPELTPEENIPGTIEVQSFEVIGSTIFSQEELAEITREYTNRPISFAELLQVRSKITQYYHDRGYITTGAFIPPQNSQDGVIQIQVIEGEIEEINIQGTNRLHPNYIRSRLGIAVQPPLNVKRLQEALQLLQLDPLIENLSSELSTGTKIGSNILEVEVREADSFSVQLPFSNSRSPSVGSDRRGINIIEGNVLGLGDSLALGYSNTTGSNGFDFSYTLPLNPYNGTVRLALGNTSSTVIEEPFDILDIRSKSSYYEVTLRQPIRQTPSEEFVMGLTFSHQTSATTLLDIPFPLSNGADDDGVTKLSVLRFFQEWTKRSEREVLAARSQFNLGVNWFDSTQNTESPDSNFFSWQGQFQWVRLLAEDTLFVLRADSQISDRPMLSLEQFAMGGQETVRGYRQDVLLADNGVVATAELRIPLVRVPEIQGLLQIAPFIDFGLGWNNTEDNTLDTNVISSFGLGLRWQQWERLNIRLDWGIPLTNLDSTPNTLQENGLYFSINYLF
ncbi:ShlB/FhaC/HecB family hemolysin secretion/activation protein [Spirulina sp. 06S082]|uniref:ShlB/FhaC/HecB family hemolysin secretion/activation protein n=1 Tax=Spirulina sp. 06S082 TaxID=3110248 RepID=UPI002B1FB50D|nr:ShlB/FhaC/HecB family hemolysin secretion/activation protein [Spirulina sp. 06S082]MEA5468067.1 ShlB/FhaC/HecB family hemolysin secretion/activation protein [Spirulina sp. 06S082]